MPDCIYLRKSRKDEELEALGTEETLARHRRALLAHANQLGRSVTGEYAEVATGDSLAARPQMQRLLRDVEAGKWDAVHVMEVERLARGDSLDQGVVARAFKYARTLIITPLKIYDPTDEFDEEYFEFGLFMSRREYKSITRRMQRGRAASAGEGKWPGNRAPYGYHRTKLTGQKGWTLSIDEARADVVRDVFRWYTSNGPGANGGRLGIAQIARRLNADGIPSAGGGEWSRAAVRALLRNPAYAGLVRWGQRAAVKRIVDGAVVVSRPVAPADAVLLAEGLHTPLVPRAVYNAAQTYLNRRAAGPMPRQTAMQNPLAGLLVCGVCGRVMLRRPYTDGRPAALVCPKSGCMTVSSELRLVESAVLESLRAWYADFEPGGPPQSAEDPISLARARVRASAAALKRLHEQQRRACELVEQGVYSPEQYAARSVRLAGQVTAAERALAQAEQTLQTTPAPSPPPAPAHILDVYSGTLRAEDKNALLRGMVERVVYTKTHGARWGGGDMALSVYPRLPGAL